MEKEVKQISVKNVLNRIILINSLYFALVTVYMILTLQSNLLKSAQSNPFALILFIGMVITYLSSFYELRLVKQDGTYFLPIARHFLFWGKLFLIVISIGAMALFYNYVGLILTILVAVSIFYILIAVLSKKLNKEELIYIDYRLSKLKFIKSARKYAAGIIVSTILFTGDIIYLIYSIIFFINENSYKNTSMLSSSIVIAVILILLITFYITAFVREKKGDKNAANRIS